MPATLSPALGIPSIGVTCGGIQAGQLRDAGAVEVYQGPRDLLENLGSSAIGRLLALQPNA